MPFHRHALVAALLSAAFVIEVADPAAASNPSHPASRVTVAYDGYATPMTRTVVKEPVRIKPTLGPRDIVRPVVVRGSRPLTGRHVAGPPLLRPDQIDAVIRAVRQRRAVPVQQQPLSVVQPVALPRQIPHGQARGSVIQAASAPPSVPAASTRSTQSLPGNPNASGAGINPWWRYQEENVPGGGHVMVNVGSGNLLLQDDDMSVAHKGIALAFRRTYNSQSLHDVYGDDGAPGMYGNGWTNTFDAHLTGSASAINVWDIDGAVYTYTYQSGGWQAPPGQYATLVSDGACGFLWTKKSGTTYYFWAPYQPSTCGASYATYGGYAGLLSGIIGRNRNVVLTLSYSWDGGITTPAGKISEIVVTTESGMTASLAFTDVNGYRLLQSLTFPGSTPSTTTIVNYGYDGNGDLTTVTHPSNNVAGILPTQMFGYARVGTNLLMSYAGSPRSYAACQGSGGCFSDGGGLIFGFAGTTAPTSTVSSIQQAAVVNPIVPDGTNSGPIQGSAYASNVIAYNTEYFTTGVTSSTFRDTDGHMTNWTFDPSGHPQQTQECTASTGQGTACSAWLWTSERWDTNNHLTSETDARGNETDYAYDANGNTIAVAQPAPAAGAFRPTALYSYDAYNNVVAYCDPVATNASVTNGDWTATPPPSDSLCPQSSIATQMQWTYPSYEPYGELTGITTPGTSALPSGYHKAISYDPARQGGTDFGLPTLVLGASIAQTIDATTPTRQPRQDLWYDANGNILCSGNGTGEWILTYDSLNRLTSAADPDDSASGTGVCSKTGAQSGWNTTSRTTYFADGFEGIHADCIASR